LAACLNLSSALLREGQWDEAVASSEKALEIQPANSDAHNNLAVAMAKKGRTREAIFHWQKALEIQPDKVGSQVSLARVLATSPDDSIRDGVRAVNLAEQALKLSGGRSPAILQTLAAAYAETGQFARAVETARRALELTTAQGNTPLAEALQKEIALYQAGSPYHETPK
jgi:Flp pilus assembly protein TadD